jgi:transcriptional regulator with XRE-family HTH domain
MPRNSIELDENAREQLKQARARLGLTQEELGLLVGVGRVTIAKYESGMTGPSPEALDSLCRELGLGWRRGGVVIYQLSAKKSSGK